MKTVANYTARPQRRTSLTCLIAVATALAGNHAAAQESAARVEELITTATRLPRTIENIAGTVSIIPAETIEYEMVNDLDDIVRYQPGLTLDTAARGGNLGFRIRGIGGNRVLTVIDGIRSSDIYAAGPSSYGKDSFEMDNLKSVEIVRGPASVLYGADAMGGAVLLTSKDPADYVSEPGSSYFKLRSAVADADQQAKLGFTAVHRWGSVGAVLEYTRRNFEEQEVAGPGALNPQDGDSDALHLRTVWQLAENHSLVLSADSFSENVATVLESELSASTTRSLGRDNTDRMLLGADYRWAGDSMLADELQLSLRLQQSDGRQRTVQDLTSYSFLNPQDPSTYGGTAATRDSDFEFNQETVALNVNFWKTISSGDISHSLAYGLNFDETETERPRNRCEQAVATGATTCKIAAYPFAPTEDFPNKTFPDSNTRRFGIYLQDEIELGDSGLVLIPGYRYDRYDMRPSPDGLVDAATIGGSIGGFSISDVSADASSLSLGAIYDLSESVSLFAQYAEGYRPPNFDESNQAFVNLGFGYATIPNPELDAESSKGVEVGVRASLGKLFLSVAAFNNSYEDFIESAFGGVQNGISLFQDRNIGSVKIRGAELSSNLYLSDRWQARASLAYIKGDNESADTPLDSVDPITAVFGLRYDSRQRNWGGEAIVTAVAEKDRVSSPSFVTADSYSTTDLIAFYSFSDAATLRLGAFNLFDEEYARWTSLSGMDVSNTAAIERANQPGRNFRIGFSYEF